jgi:FHS family L-fucose permease-like MFS transporter
VMGPYLGLGVVLLAIGLMIAFKRAPEIVDEYPSADLEGQSPLKILLSNRHYVLGVIAQFFNVAAQVCTWTYLIQYSQQALHGSLQLGGYLLQVSLIVFLISRFVMTWVIGRIRATAAMAVLGALAVVLCLFAIIAPNVAGVVAVVALSFCLSLMFPTIYGVALKGLGPATKFGAAGLVMAIVGGAIMPLVQGHILDVTSPAVSFVVPAVCFAVVTGYAVFDLAAAPSVKGAKA